MTDRDDNDESNKKDNVDPRLEMKNTSNPDRLPRGSISMPSPGGSQKSSLTNSKRFEGMTTDQKKNAGKGDQPTFERTGDREVDQHYAKKNRMVEKDDTQNQGDKKSPPQKGNDGPER